MHPKKKRQEREKELQALLATPDGREELEKLAALHAAVSG